MPIVVAVALLATPAGPALTVLRPAGSNCGRPALLTPAGPQALLNAAPGLCVIDAFTANLEQGLPANVVLLVQRGDNRQLFIYRRHGRQLTPRFLGSALPGLQLLTAEPAADGLALLAWTRTTAGTYRLLHCGFTSFSLTCDEMPHAS